MLARLGMTYFHHTARTRDFRLMFHTWRQGVDLWRRVLRVAPEPTALCLMPDHLHLLYPRDVRRQLASALSGYTRSLGKRALMERLPEPEVVLPGLKLQRNVRYIHLNPCRARLVDDPLAWPLSTHRDAVGMALPPARRAHPDPLAHHSYVSGDPSVRVGGTDVPTPNLQPTVEALVTAVSAVTRTPVEDVLRSGSARRLAIAAGWFWAEADHHELRDTFRVSVATLYRYRSAERSHLDVVARAAHDARFPALQTGPLQADWGKYRRYRD